MIRSEALTCFWRGLHVYIHDKKKHKERNKSMCAFIFTCQAKWKTKNFRERTKGSKEKRKV